MSSMNTLYGWSTQETRDGADTRKKDLDNTVVRCTEQVGQTAALKMVPFSVEQRMRGLVRHRWYCNGKRITGWVSPDRRDYLTHQDQLFKLRQEMKKNPAPVEINWFKIVQEEEDILDAEFVEMSDSDWEDWKNKDIRSWISREQRFNGLIFWDRIDRKRQTKIKTDTESVGSGWSLEQDLTDEPWKYDAIEAYQCDMDCSE